MVIYPEVGLGPALAVALAFALPLIALVIKNRRLWTAYTTVGTLAILIISTRVLILAYQNSKPLVYTFGGWPAPLGIVYVVDKVGAFFGFIAAILFFAIALFSYKYLEKDDGVEWYYTLLLGLEAGVLGCFYTGDAFNLFVMLEVLSVAAYGLVAFRKRLGIAVEGALKYAIISAMATTIYFVGLMVLYASFGTLNMADIAYKIMTQGKILSDFTPNPAIITGIPPAGVNWALGLAIFGALMFYTFTFEAALVPNHFWLPDAYSYAPAPIAALLSGAAENVGLYVLIRFIYTIMGSEPAEPIRHVMLVVLMAMGMASALLGSLMMVPQRNVQRLLGYSTIVNMGYTAMAIGLGTELGLRAALFFVLAHAFSKALAFISVGAMKRYAGSVNLDELEGYGKNMRFTSISLGVALLSLAGIPPLPGFIAKLLLYFAALEVGAWYIVAVLILATAISLMGYLKVLYHTALKASERELRAEEPLSLTISIAILLGVIISITILVYQVYYGLVTPAAASSFNTEEYIESVFSISSQMLKLIGGGG